MSTCWVYLFELKSVQNLIFESGKLREIVGASELIARLTDKTYPDPNANDDSLLGVVLATIGENSLQFTRRAGASVFVSSASETNIKRFAALWELCVQHAIPGLEFVRALAEACNYNKAFAAARIVLQAARNCPQVHFPPAGPLLLRNPRTARAVVEKLRDDTLLDELSAKKRLLEDGAALKNRFLDATKREFCFPIDFEATDDPKRNIFPFVGDSRLIAIVHADGTGLGQLLMKLGAHTFDDDAKARDAYLAVSTILTAAGIAAARKATADVLIAKAGIDKTFGVLPARPIILGGEDFSAIVRADLALEFTACFLREFEDSSESLLTDAKKKDGAFHGIKDFDLTKFTACAAIVFVKASQPFARAHALAESMVGRLKMALKTAGLDGSASALGFYRDATGSLTDAGAAFEQGKIKLKLKTESGPTTEPTTYATLLPGYCVNVDSKDAPIYGDKFPHYQHLSALVTAARALPRGPLREILSLAELDFDAASQRYKRIVEVQAKDNPDAFKNFTVANTALFGAKPDVCETLELFQKRVPPKLLLQRQ